MEKALALVGASTEYQDNFREISLWFLVEISNIFLFPPAPANMSAVYTRGETRRNIILCKDQLHCGVWEVGAAWDWPASVLLSAASNSMQQTEVLFLQIKIVWGVLTLCN